MNEKDTELNINIRDFKNAFKNMTPTDKYSYYDYLSKKNSFVELYTREEVEDALRIGNSITLSRISNSYFYRSGFYRRILIYYSTLLKYSNILIPHPKRGRDISEDSLAKKYYDALDFSESFNVPLIAQHCAIKTLVDGAYYGFLVDNGKGEVTMQDLPFEFCRTRFKNSKNVDIVEFNVTYFDRIIDKEKRNQCIDNFPKSVRKAYNAYKNSNKSKWYAFKEGEGIYFNIIEEKPMMLNIIPAVIDFGDYRKIEKEKDQQEIKKILVEKIPSSQDKLLFEPEEAAAIHNGVVEMLKGNKDIDVLTTYADVQLKDMQDSRQTISNNLEKIEKSIYSESGTSKQIFSADTNLSLEKSIANDLSLMMIFARKFSNWFEFIINSKFSNSSIYFNFEILPISYYNEKDYEDRALKSAQYGFSFILPAIASGISQRDLLDIKDLEINLLKLDQVLIPLKSSHTESNKESNGATDEGGRKALPEDEKSDRTIENIESSGGN